MPTSIIKPAGNPDNKVQHSARLMGPRHCFPAPPQHIHLCFNKKERAHAEVQDDIACVTASGRECTRTTPQSCMTAQQSCHAWSSPTQLPIAKQPEWPGYLLEYLPGCCPIFIRFPTSSLAAKPCGMLNSRYCMASAVVLLLCRTATRFAKLRPLAVTTTVTE